MFIYVISEYFFIFQPEKELLPKISFLAILHSIFTRNALTSQMKYNGKNRSIKLKNNVLLFEE